MRTFVVLLLSCAFVWGADTGMQVMRTATTNATSATLTVREVFMRDGQTNLIRSTKTKAGVLQICIQRLYYAGALVGMLTETPDSSSLLSEAGCPFALDLEYGRSGGLKFAAIVSQDAIIVDAFACTNGILSAVSSSQLADVAKVGIDGVRLIHRAPKRSPEQFRREVDLMLEKHGAK